MEAAQQSLEDTQKTCQKNLETAYEDALNILDAAFLEGEESLNLVNNIFQDYFIPGGQLWITMKDNKDKIKEVLERVKPYLDKAKTSSEKDID